jgi:hypothetical protein
MVDVDSAVGATKNRQSIVMIRNVPAMHTNDDIIGSLHHVTVYNMALQRGARKGIPRANCKDLGTMYAIGTRVELDRVNTVAYQANTNVPMELLRSLVVNLATIGRNCFPQVYSVVRDTEGNSGLLPVEPMNGDEEANPVPDVQIDGPSSGNDDIGERKECRRVGYTIDVSVNLGNASHYDVHDASQGYSVWTEENPGRGANWYFILPNVHGKRPDGVTYRGMAVKLGHGVAISWDGRVIRHCTSVSKPDGIHGRRVGDRKASQFENNLYGTFTAAKERIVQAGRALSAATYVPSEDDDGFDVEPRVKGKKKHRKQKRKRNSKRGHADLVESKATTQMVPQDPSCGKDLLMVGTEPPAFFEESPTLPGAFPMVAAMTPESNRTPVGGDAPLPAHDPVEVLLTTGWDDQHIGGQYKIPRKRKPC